MGRIIQFCYRKIIDVNARHAWEKMIFEDTHKEFLMQAQQFDQSGKYATFQQMIALIPTASRMHYLVSTAAIGYLQQFNEQIPDVLDVHGRRCLLFKNFRFEILDSHRFDKTRHRIAIYFHSEAVTWIDTVHSHLLLAHGDQTTKLMNGEIVETFLMGIMPELNIVSCQQKQHLVTDTSIVTHETAVH